MIDAIVPVWKPVKWTSFDVIRKIKPLVKPAKVGHSGSLDPFAEGLLIVCIGKMTQQTERLMDLEKEYEATVALGCKTDTLDPTGKVIETADVPALSKKHLEQVMAGYTGVIEQIPPMFSALRMGGRRLYKLARKGKVIDRPPRPVRIDEIELQDWTEKELKIRVVCGRGTYIRALARDIARDLGTVGHLVQLTRTRIGEYRAADAQQIEDLPNWISSAA